MNVEAALSGGGPVADKLRTSLLRRMGDVSEFMKTVKQRFSVWYNRTHQRYGTLWAERFKSVLVENDPRALATVAAYIDLNPVRAPDRDGLIMLDACRSSFQVFRRCGCDG